MASGLETRGQVARTMAGTEGVEIKATIPEGQVDLALQAYGLNLDDNERYIYFFDTPELDLFGQGIIARRGASSALPMIVRSSFARSTQNPCRRSGVNTAASRSRPTPATRAS